VKVASGKFHEGSGQRSMRSFIAASLWRAKQKNFLYIFFNRVPPSRRGGTIKEKKIFCFARPSDWISELRIRIFVKKSSDFNQKAS